MRHVLLPALASFALAATAAAQSFNLDLHGPTPALVPSPAYAAAAPMPGVWNGVPCTGTCDGVILPLVDLTGAATPVSARVSQGTPAFCPDPTTSGDDEALLENGPKLQGLSLSVSLGFEHLQPGTYDVYVYAGDSCEPPSGDVEVTMFAGFPGQSRYQTFHLPASGWNGGFQEGVNYSRMRCRIEAGHSLSVVMQGVAGHMAQGVQLVRLQGDVHSVCFGTNEYVGVCPCGPGAFGRGCPSSVAPDGAALDGTGQALVAADTLSLTATYLPDAPLLVFQGTQFAGNGAESTPFGDGLRCAGGSTVRIATKTASMGTATYPEAGDLPISVRGGVPATGGFRLYQVWYRNAAPFCTSATFNLTNAVAVDWR